MKYLQLIHTAIIALLLWGCEQKATTQEESSEAATASDTQPSRPNIILLMADDLGWGDTGYGGNDSIFTPNLDAMAAQGLVMNRFYAAAPVCSPTRGSCITGRNPYRYGIFSANVGRMKPEEITLAEILRDNGYRTGHFGKWHLGTLTKDTLDANRGGKKGAIGEYSPPWENGFEECFSTESKVPTWNPMVTPEKDAGGVGKKEIGSFFGTRYWTGEHQVETENLEGDDSRVIVDRAIPFIEKCAQGDAPFFTVIWFHTPHTPVVANDAYRMKYETYDEAHQHFFGCVTAMDEQIGRLNKALADLGVDKNTAVFFTSDNGPEQLRVGPRCVGSTNGLSGRKRSLLEGGIRVPGILKYPNKVAAGSSTDIPMITSDYLPTALAMAGIDYPSERPLDGQDLLALMATPQERGLAFRFYDQWAYIKGNQKVYSNDKGETYALYDIAKDPQEQNDLSEAQPEARDALVNEMKAWASSQQASLDGEDY